MQTAPHISATAIDRAKGARPLRVLIVDDSETDAESLSRMLRRQTDELVMTVETDTAAAALELLAHETIDVALVDYRLPDMNGLDLLRSIAAEHPETATVLLTGQGSEAVAVQAIKGGARDYLVKRDITPAGLQQVVTQAAESARIDRQHRHHLAHLQRATADLDHFVRSLSHDMSANFMVLESSFRQLKRSCNEQPAPEVTEGVTHVEACLRESKRFVDDLVTLAKTGSVGMEPARVEVSQVVAEVLYELEAVITERGIVVDVEAELPVVWCNDSRVRQVIGNLVRNAIKHGCDPAFPRIVISRPVLPMPTNPGVVWLRIYDNGSGIPAAARQEIFLPGRRLPTARAEGTGMGLAIVKRIVEHYDGSIAVDEQCTHGTAFVLSLPRA